MLSVTLAPWGDTARLRACHVVVGPGLPAGSAVAPHGGRVARCIEVTLSGRASYYLDLDGGTWAAANQAAARDASLSGERLDILVPATHVAMVLEDHEETLRAWLAAVATAGTTLTRLRERVAEAPPVAEAAPALPATEAAPAPARPASKDREERIAAARAKRR